MNHPVAQDVQSIDLCNAIPTLCSATVEAHVTRMFLKLSLEENPASHRRVLAVLTFLRN